MSPARPPPLSLEALFPAKNNLQRAIFRKIEDVLKVTEINALYKRVGKVSTPKEFCDRAAMLLDLKFQVSDKDLAEIPRSGPLIVVSNHPTGAAEGLGILKVLLSVRPDVRVMAYDYLHGISELGTSIIKVAPSSLDERQSAPMGPVRECLQFLKAGGALALFPSGAVSHFHWRSLRIEDPLWLPLPIWLALKTGAPILPTYFMSKNSVFYHVIGLLHPTVRTLLLGRELLKKRGTLQEYRVGRVFKLEAEKEVLGLGGLMLELRQRVYDLASRQP